MDDECGLFDQLFVGGMVTNPKPSSRAGLEYTQGPESQRDSERPKMSRGFNTLKSEGGIKWIFFPKFRRLCEPPCGWGLAELDRTPKMREGS